MVAEGGSRVGSVVEDPRTAPIFARLARFNARPGRRTIYLVGNHDNQIWWDARERRALLDGGYASAIALGYARAFGAPDHGALLYCDHGAEYDPANAIRDYANPLATPLGHHLVLDLVNHLEPLGRRAPEDAPTSIADIDNIHPLEMVPWWFVSRVFYRGVEQVATRLALPALLLYLVFHLLPVALIANRLITRHPRLEWLSDVPHRHLVLLALLVFDSSLALGVLALALLRRAFHRARVRYGLEDIGTIYGRSERFWEETTDGIVRGERRPAFWEGPWPGCDVFVYGHTHFAFVRPVAGDAPRLVVNAGTWTRKVYPVRARLWLPPVFLPTYELTYALAYARDGALQVELWEAPKAIRYTLRWPERLAILRRERPRGAGPAGRNEPCLAPRLLARAAVPFHAGAD
ncbi:MAG: hypothetical protein IRY97_09140, partial [Thermomicrobiaceae bacterium]|nr:hypothetical protein [Thermomicrobiaceae bacterium]